MKITIPELCLVALVGPSGSGKSHFASRHFRPTEVISSDACRAMVADDANDQSATPDAFELLNFIAAKRLRAGRLTVIDATSVQPEARKPLVGLAREHDCLAVAIVLNMPESLCQARNRERPDRSFGRRVVRRQVQQLRRSLRRLRREGFRHVFVLNTPEEVEAVTIERARMWTDLRQERGPFDIIGDVHGCFDELTALLERLGYRLESRADASGETRFSVTHPEGRKAVFVGDLVDRGPGVTDVLRLVMSMTADGAALCVAGNHESKLVRKLRGRKVQVSHGMAETLAQLEMESPEFRQQADRVHGWTDKPLRPGRREPGGGARGDKGGVPGPRVSPRPRLLPLWRDHRRDGRIRTADTRRLGRRLSWESHGRVRPHRGRGTRLAEPHHQHRHRLRIRRQADRAKVSRKGTRVGSGGQGLLRSRETPCRGRSV